MMKSPAGVIAWTGTATLTLDAYNDVNIKNAIEAHDKGGLNIISGDGNAGGNGVGGGTEVGKHVAI